MVGSCPANFHGTRDDGVTHMDLMKPVELLAAGGGQVEELCVGIAYLEPHLAGALRPSMREFEVLLRHDVLVSLSLAFLVFSEQLKVFRIIQSLDLRQGLISAQLMSDLLLSLELFEEETYPRQLVRESS